MLRYGLTGGIASGKSAVAAMLREEGFPVLEADRMAHDLTELGGAAYSGVVRLLGEAILNPDRSINRNRVAAVVFNNPEKLQQLNDIIHPLVEEELVREFASLEECGSHRAAFVEAALIFEAGLHHRLDGVAVAWCLPEQQLERLIERGMSEAEARKRIAAQMSVEQKLALATEKIDCSGSLEKTREQVRALAGKLYARAQPI